MGVPRVTAAAWIYAAQLICSFLALQRDSARRVFSGGSQMCDGPLALLGLLVKWPGELLSRLKLVCNARLIASMRVRYLELLTLSRSNSASVIAFIHEVSIGSAPYFLVCYKTLRISRAQALQASREEPNHRWPTDWRERSSYISAAASAHHILIDRLQPGSHSGAPRQPAIAAGSRPATPTR